MRRDERYAAVLAATFLAVVGTVPMVVAVSRGVPQEMAVALESSPWIWVVGILLVVVDFWLLRQYIRESMEVGPPPVWSLPYIGVDDEE